MQRMTILWTVIGLISLILSIHVNNKPYIKTYFHPLTIFVLGPFGLLISMLTIWWLKVIK